MRNAFQGLVQILFSNLGPLKRICHFSQTYESNLVSTMSGDESNNVPAEQQPSKRLKLVLKTSPLSTPVEPQAEAKDGSSSPPRPSFSPVTPTLSHEKLAVQEKREAQWMDEPSPLPLSLDENADAIALRATISLLQMQRQQSLKDIRDLDKIRDAALDDPRGFADDLRAGKLKKPLPQDITFDDVDYVDDEEEEQDKPPEASSKFTRLPNPQNIARCPPIEWSKYHVLGEPLDDMHEMQKKRPGVSANDFAANEHEIAAPYRPFKDKIGVKKDRKG